MFFDGTTLVLARFQLRGKMVNGQPATQQQLDSLEATRRLLMRMEAVHAASWLWTSDDLGNNNNNTLAAEGTNDGAATSSAQLASLLPAMRRKAGRRGALLPALFR